MPKITPVMGALKAAEIPAAAPQPTSVRKRLGEALSQRPIRDAAAAPSTTTGPSAPTEPPVPITIAAAAVLKSTGANGMTPPFTVTRYITSGMFSPPDPRAPQRTSARQAARPSAITTGMRTKSGSSACSDSRSTSRCTMSIVL